jgi:hypothetical protein
LNLTNGNIVLPDGLIIKYGIVGGGSANNDNWWHYFSDPYPTACLRALVSPMSSAGQCPKGWYIVGFDRTLIRVFCGETVPLGGFSFIAVGH